MDAARCFGASTGHILIRHVLPNAIQPVLVQMTLLMAVALLAEASLSFLGLGMQPPTADWGLMINENRIALAVQPWGVLLPVLAIAVLTVGTNLIADGVAAERAAVGC